MATSSPKIDGDPEVVETPRENKAKSPYPPGSSEALVEQYLIDFDIFSARVRAGCSIQPKWHAERQVAESQMKGDRFQKCLREQLDQLAMQTCANVAREGKGTASLNAVKELRKLVFPGRKATAGARRSWSKIDGV